MNEINIAATFRARFRPSVVPRAIVPTRFSSCSAFCSSSLRSTAPAALGCSVSVLIIQRLSAAGAHESSHHLRRLPDDELHDSVVIEDGKKGGNENDGGEHLEGNVEAQG